MKWILVSEVFRRSTTSYLHSFSPKSPSTQSSSHHQFYSISMQKSSNHQLLNAKISISNFPKFSISTAFKAQIHQIISKFKPNLQSTGKHKPPLNICASPVNKKNRVIELNSYLVSMSYPLEQQIYKKLGSIKEPAYPD